MRSSAGLATKPLLKLLSQMGGIANAEEKKKLSLDEAATALAKAAEKHLSKLPEEEQEWKVAAFSHQRLR